MISKYTFSEEFNIKHLDATIKKVVDNIIDHVKHKKMENIKIKVEITDSKIDFKVTNA